MTSPSPNRVDDALLQQLIKERDHLRGILAILRRNEASQLLMSYIKAHREPVRAKNEWLSNSIREGAFMAGLLGVVTTTLFIIFFVQLIAYLSWQHDTSSACLRLDDLALAALLLKALMFGSTIMATICPSCLKTFAITYFSFLAFPVLALSFLTYLAFVIVLLWNLALSGEVCVQGATIRQLLWPSALLPVCVAGMPFFCLYCKKQWLASGSDLRAMARRNREIEQHLDQAAAEAPHVVQLLGLPGSLLLVDMIRREAEARGKLSAWVGPSFCRVSVMLEEVFPSSLASLIDHYRGVTVGAVEVETSGDSLRNSRSLRLVCVPGVLYDDATTLSGMAPKKWWLRTGAPLACVLCSLNESDKFVSRISNLRIATTRLALLAGFYPSVSVLVLDIPEREIKVRQRRCHFVSKVGRDHGVFCVCEWCTFSRVEQCWLFEDIHGNDPFSSSSTSSSSTLPSSSSSSSRFSPAHCLLDMDRLVANLEGSQLDCWIVCVDLKAKTGGTELLQLLRTVTDSRERWNL